MSADQQEKNLPDAKDRSQKPGDEQRKNVRGEHDNCKDTPYTSHQVIAHRVLYERGKARLQDNQRHSEPKNNQCSTQGFVLGEMREAEAQRRTGLNKEEWQQQMIPYVQEQVIASGRYPYLVCYIAESEERPSDEMFIFDLTRLLDGIAAYIATFNH